MAGFYCKSCGAYHNELPRSWGVQAPVCWYQIPERDRAKRAVLTSDQCVVDNEHFFVLGRIVLPVLDDGSEFAWLAWVSLSEINFKRARDLWYTKGREAETPYFGWLQSALPYEECTLSLKTHVHTQPVGERPLIEVEATDHPLSQEQRRGISLARVQEIAESMLHGALANYPLERTDGTGFHVS